MEGNLWDYRMIGMEERKEDSRRKGWRKNKELNVRMVDFFVKLSKT